MQQAQLQQMLLSTTQNPPNAGPANTNAFPNRGASPTAGGQNAPTAPQRPPHSPNTNQNAATNERYALLRQRIFHARLGAQALARIHDRNNNPPHFFLPAAVHRLFAHIGSFVPIPVYLRRTFNVFGALRLNMAHNLIHLTQNQTRLDNLRRITLNSIEIRPVIIAGAETASHTVAPSAATDGNETFPRNSSENHYTVEAMNVEPHSAGDSIQDNLNRESQLIEEERQHVPEDKSCLSHIDEVVNVLDDHQSTRQSVMPHQSSFSGTTLSSCGASSLSERPLSPGSTPTSSSVATASK